MKDFNIALAAVSFLLLASGLVYKKIKRSIGSEPILATLAGILLGPQVLNLLDMQDWGSKETIMDVACRLTIGMALMSTALRIPKPYLKENTHLQVLLVLVGMVGMCIFSTLLLKLIFGFDWLVCLLIGAVITPTDPVAAATIVAGETAKKLLPGNLRNGLSFEAGANDGLAFPFVFLPLLLIQKPGHALQEWLLKPVLWETGGGILLGLLIGYVAGKLLVKARKANWMSQASLLSFSMALGFFVLSFLELLHCNGIVGVFAAGYAAKLVLSKEEDVEQDNVQEAMERIFTIPVFLLFGLILPWHDWLAFGWKAIVVVAAVLLLRRLPVFLLMRPFLRKIHSWPDVLMAGWFGPIGVAAMFYMMICLRKLGMQEVWIVGSLIVFGSTLVHGVTSYPLAKLYQKKTGFRPDPKQGDA